MVLLTWQNYKTDGLEEKIAYYFSSVYTLDVWKRDNEDNQSF